MKVIDTKALKALLTHALEKLIHIIEKKKEDASTHVPGDSTAIPETNNEPETPETPQIEEIPASTGIKIVSFGSPNCSKATEDPNTQIKDFRWSKSGMSYKWAKGNLRNWGITNDHDASALAIAGWFDGKEWRFAKFDWISTDRLTRGHENIEEHYNGFPSEYFSASKHGFFIMSKDGKRRTNVLHQ